MNALTPIVTQPSNAEIYRASTDAAGLCREIVLKTAMEIQDRKYVKVEGWQAIAIAHGCTAGAREVEAIDGGVRAIGEVRRMSDGGLIATAEGFVGMDEPTWYGGTVEKDEWTGPKGSRRKTGKKITTSLPKRPDYAIRAMAQTRAISRACRSAFAHVVVLIDSNLSTTPAEEVPVGGFDDDMRDISPPKTRAADREAGGEVASAAVTAAMTGITICKTQAELTEWVENNGNAVAALTAAEQARVKAHHRTRWDALETPRAATPFDDMERSNG